MSEPIGDGDQAGAGSAVGAGAGFRAGALRFGAAFFAIFLIGFLAAAFIVFFFLRAGVAFFFPALFFVFAFFAMMIVLPIQAASVKSRRPPRGDRHRARQASRPLNAPWWKGASP